MADAPLTPCPFCKTAPRHLGSKSGFYAERVICDSCGFYLPPETWALCTPSTPVAAPPATPDLQKRHDDLAETIALMLAAVGYTEEYARQWPSEKASVTFNRWFDEQTAAQPQPQPAQPLTGTAAKVRAPLSDAQIEKLREATFSTNNPFCPCDSKTMRKAVWAAERAHGITAPSTPIPSEVAP